MANASAKRIAAQNEKTIRNLHIGSLVAFILSLLIRVVLRRPFPPSKKLTALLVLTSAPAVVIYRYLVRSGTSRRDRTGSLLSSGEDLNSPGVTEWCFDILYITWTCHIGSALLGEWVWWLYLIIPAYAIFKIWTVFVQPTFFSRSGASDTPAEDNANEGVSKRQQKLRQRQERGDPRIRAAPAKR